MDMYFICSWLISLKGNTIARQSGVIGGIHCTADWAVESSPSPDSSS